MARILFPSDIDWSLGTFVNCFQDGSAIRPNYELSNIISVFLFNNNIIDSTGNRSLILTGNITSYPTGLENQAIYLEPGSYLSVDDASAYAPPIYHCISFYANTLPSNPAPILKSDAYTLEVYTGTLRLRVQTSGGEIVFTDGILAGEWYRVVFWITATEAGLNKNGNTQVQAISEPLAPTYLQLGGSDGANWDGLIDAWFSYSALDQSAIDSYILDAWVPVDSCEWMSPVIAPVMRPLEPVFNFSTVDLLPSSTVQAFFRGWAEKPSGNYTRITTLDGYEVDYSSDAAATGDWIAIDQFASFAPRVFQVKLTYTR